MTVLMSPSSVTAEPVRSAGGDTEVPRDKLGRPRIKNACYDCKLTGKIPSPKTGKDIQCPKCKGAGHTERSYTRVTTYIDVLDDKTNLQAWGERMVLIGVARDTTLLKDVLTLDESREEKESKDILNRKAQIAKDKAGSSEKADLGTHKHALSELVDLGMDLPEETSFEDVIDMNAYRWATEWLCIVHMEKLVVNDQLGVAGTPDRVSRLNIEVISRLLEEGVGSDLFKIEDGKIFLVAPDGSLIGEDDLLITDLKTGRVDYGALKMAMQLSIYSRSALYDVPTGARQVFGGNVAEGCKVNTKWGIIMNVAPGSGEAALYWVDLELGWRAVEVAGQVRALRSQGSKALLKMHPVGN